MKLVFNPLSGTFDFVEDLSGYAPLTGAIFTGNVTAPNLDISNWNTAYGWGNHASAGYLTSISGLSHTLLSDIGTLTHATIDSYLNQAVKTTSSPTFAGLSLNGDISIDGDTANRVISMGRETTAATQGRALTINAGGATSGATNKAGGGLFLMSGISTGNTASSIYLQATEPGATGTTDRNPVTVMTVTGNSVIFSPKINTFNSRATRDVISLSLSTNAVPVGSEFLRGMKCSAYLSGGAGGFSHLFCGGYFQGGFVSVGYSSDPFPGGQTHIALGGYFSGYVFEQGINKFDDNLTQIGGWFTTDGVATGTGTKQYIGGYFEKDLMVKTGQKIILEGGASLLTKAVTIGDTYLIANDDTGGACNVDIYVDNTQVINFDNDLIDAKVALKITGGIQSDGGNAGIDTSFVDADGNTITVENGLITAKTAP